MQPCNKSVIEKNPLCQHEVKIPCHLSAFSGWVPWGKGLAPGNVLDEVTAPPVAPPDALAKYVLSCKENMEVQRRNCGHRYTTQCGKAISSLGKPNKSQCTEKLVNAKLTCGHAKDFLCWQYEEYKKNPAKEVCKEEIHLTCWNHAVCGSIMKSVCNKAGSLIKCNKKSDWECKNGHVVKNVALCEKGYPSGCGECVLVDIRGHIKTLEQLKTNGKSAVLPNLPAEIKERSKYISNKENVKQFIESQVTVLRGLEQWSSNQDASRRPLFTYSLVPCFRYGFGDDLKQTSFASYVQAATLNGTQVCEWTVNNIEQLIVQTTNQRANEVELLFGFVFCCRVLVDPHDYPGKKKKPYEKQQYKKQKRHSDKYFCIQHNRIGGWDHLIVWDPYPMIATHRVWMTRSDLQQLSSQLKAAPIPVTRWKNLGPQFIKYSIPEDAESHVTTYVEVQEDDEEEGELDDDDVTKEEGSPAKKVSAWDGLSLGQTEIFSDNVQQELMNKLQCCIKASG